MIDQRLYREGAPASVRRHRYPPAVGMPVALMRSGLAYENEAITGEGGDQFSSGKRSKAPVIDGHRLDSDRDAGLFLRDNRDFH